MVIYTKTYTLNNEYKLQQAKSGQWGAQDEEIVDGCLFRWRSMMLFMVNSNFLFMLVFIRLGQVFFQFSIVSVMRVIDLLAQSFIRSVFKIDFANMVFNTNSVHIDIDR